MASPLSERDRALLLLASEHRVILAPLAAFHLGCSTSAAMARLRRLTSTGLLRRERDYRVITAAGLRAVGSRYSASRKPSSCPEHDSGIAWVWLAAEAGAWGPMREITTERQMRSLDASETPNGGRAEVAQPFGVRLGGFGAGGKPRLHYPDLLMVTPGGERIAVELELTSKSRSRRETILAGYGADPRIDGVLYLVDSPGVERALRDSARRVGVSSLLCTQRVVWGRGALPAGASRSPAASPDAARPQRGSGRSSDRRHSSKALAR